MVNYDYLVETGVIVPDTQDLLNTVQSEFKDAFGQDLIVTSDTPQGVLIAAEVAARSAVVRNNAALANQINPNLAGGVFLDAILALTGSARAAQTYSVAPMNLAGVAGTVIPITVQIANSNGDLFSPVGIVTLNSEGEATVNFQALKPGPIAAPANSLTHIVVGVLGLETATNPAAATLGALTQSDQAARLFRRNILAIQGNAQSEAIISGLYTVPNVLSISYRENVTNSVQVIDGVTLQPHSMYACVDGGTDLSVATMIQTKKGGGCGYSNGAGTPVTVNVTDPASGQIYPVSFDRPGTVPILVKVTLSVGQSTLDPTTTVQNALLNYVNGLLEGEPGFTLGTPVSCFELAGAINKAEPLFFIHNVQTSLISPVSFSNAEIPIAIYQKATLNVSGITVVVV